MGGDYRQGCLIDTREENTIMKFTDAQVDKLIQFLQEQMEYSKPESPCGGISKWDGKEDEQRIEEGRHFAYKNIHSFVSGLLLDIDDIPRYRSMVNFAREIKGLGPRYKNVDNSV